jgi:gamma-glutamylaminecyclotransferase
MIPVGACPYLFVYGSLKHGQPNHSLLRGAVIFGPCRTRRGYELLDLGPYPALHTGGRGRVQGELYGVDLERLAELDEFEQHPTLYERRPVELEGALLAWAYFYPKADADALPRVAGGCW